MQRKNFAFTYNLKLKEDSTFSIAIGWMKCNGTWILTPKNELLLKCAPLRPLEAISRGYMSKRDHRLKVLNPNEIQMDSVVLKRIAPSN